jgi:hypothetical protein
MAVISGADGAGLIFEPVGRLSVEIGVVGGAAEGSDREHHGPRHGRES